VLTRIYGWIFLRSRPADFPFVRWRPLSHRDRRQPRKLLHFSELWIGASLAATNNDFSHKVDGVTVVAIDAGFFAWLRRIKCCELEDPTVYLLLEKRRRQ